MPAPSSPDLRCDPGQTLVPAFAGSKVVIQPIIDPDDFYQKDEGFGWETGVVTLVCNICDMSSVMTVLLPGDWSPILITAWIPTSFPCDVAANHPSNWSYHIHVDPDQDGGSPGNLVRQGPLGPGSTNTLQTGEVWIVGQSGSGYPPMRP